MRRVFVCVFEGEGGEGGGGLSSLSSTYAVCLLLESTRTVTSIHNLNFVWICTHPWLSTSCPP